MMGHWNREKEGRRKRLKYGEKGRRKMWRKDEKWTLIWGFHSRPWARARAQAYWWSFGKCLIGEKMATSLFGPGRKRNDRKQKVSIFFSPVFPPSSFAFFGHVRVRNWVMSLYCQFANVNKLWAFQAEIDSSPSQREFYRRLRNIQAQI